MPSPSERHELLLAALKILNSSGIEQRGIKKILKLIRVYAGIDAAAIRLKNGDDFPYYASDGFSPGFIKQESSVLEPDILCNDESLNSRTSSLQCICGLVLQGKKIRNTPFFTAKGSFCINNTGKAADAITKKLPDLCLRNTCHKKGFLSMALVPLHDGNNIIGLLQINNKEKDKFTDETISFFESLGSLIGIALSQKITEEKINITNRNLEKIVEERTIEYLKALKSKETILQEMHHRIKNNLTTISSLLALQAMKLRDRTTRDHLLNAVMRVKSMGILHNKLYRYDDLENIDFKKYLHFLIEEIRNVFSIHKEKIIFNINCDDIILNIDTAIPCGLIINEIIINSIKHGFPENNKGQINISIKQERDWYFLDIDDNGIGLPPDFEKDKHSNLGMDIIWNLVKQLDGSVTIKSESGLNYSIILKREIKEEKRWTKRKFS